ncbi:MAG: PP2C family protein-serine/threonine phosphatase [Aggregatilineales bacterium]
MSDSAELDTHALSHVGNVRADNQDALRSEIAPDSLTRIYAVADGMGGYEHGGIASAVALETFMQTVCSWPGGLQSATQIEQAMRRAVQDANVAVYQESLRLHAKMGTTLTAICVSENWAHVAHVGDSRAYTIRSGQAMCLTRDHTAVGELVRARVISPEKVRGHSQRSVLNRALGIGLIVQADLNRVPIYTGDVLLLCSDGLWASIEDEQIAALAEHTASAQAIAEQLVMTALANGSDDNVSAWTICVRRAPESLSDNAAAVKRTRWPGLLRGLLHA